MIRGIFLLVFLAFFAVTQGGALAQEEMPAWKKKLFGVVDQIGEMKQDAAPSPAPAPEKEEKKQTPPPESDGAFKLDPTKFGNPAALPDGGPRPLDILDAAGKPAETPAPPAEEKKEDNAEPQAAPGPAPAPAVKKSAALYDTIFPTLSEDLQKEILNEAQAVFDDCGTRVSYAAYHDCGCIATAFTEERLRQGLDVSRSTVMLAVESQCVNEPGIAGKNYDDCYDHMSLLSDQVRKVPMSQLDDFCKCLARTMAKQYAAAPNPNYKYISAMRVNATNACVAARDRVKNPPR